MCPSLVLRVLLSCKLICRLCFKRASTANVIRLVAPTSPVGEELCQLGFIGVLNIDSMVLVD